MVSRLTVGMRLGILVALMAAILLLVGLAGLRGGRNQVVKLLKNGDRAGAVEKLAAVDKLAQVVAEVCNGAQALASAAEQVNATAQSLSQAASEQSSGVGQINAAIGQLSETTQQGLLP